MEWYKMKHRFRLFFYICITTYYFRSALYLHGIFFSAFICCILFQRSTFAVLVPWLCCIVLFTAAKCVYYFVLNVYDYWYNGVVAITVACVVVIVAVDVIVIFLVIVAVVLLLLLVACICWFNEFSER